MPMSTRPSRPSASGTSASLPASPVKPVVITQSRSRAGARSCQAASPAFDTARTGTAPASSSIREKGMTLLLGLFYCVQDARHRAHLPGQRRAITPSHRSRVMKAKDSAAEDATAVQIEDLFEMANLFPRTTGLPMTVWVSPRGNARHDVRVKVNMTHGNQMSPVNTAVVGIRPSPHVIAGRLAPEDERAVLQWVALNADA